MGAAIFALTDTVETAADLAARSGGKKELVQLLRAVEGKEMACGDGVGYAVALARHGRCNCVTSQVLYRAIVARDMIVGIFQI